MKISKTKHITRRGVIKRNPIKKTIDQRLKLAEKRMMDIEKKQSKMSVDEILRYRRNRPEEYKRDQNIINRYWNLYARSQGYARGMAQMLKEEEESL